MGLTQVGFKHNFVGWRFAVEWCHLSVRDSMKNAAPYMYLQYVLYCIGQWVHALVHKYVHMLDCKSANSQTMCFCRQWRIRKWIWACCPNAGHWGKKRGWTRWEVGGSCVVVSHTHVYWCDIWSWVCVLLQYLQIAACVWEREVNKVAVECET